MNRSFGSNSYPTSTNARMSAPATDWEDLRKQARQLENEIDTKLMSFSKLCSNYVARDHTINHHGLDSPITTTPASFETMSIEIEKLLERLTDINKSMTDTISNLAGANTPALHTLQRHHEICEDYKREYERTKANIRNFKTREDLLTNSTTTSVDTNSAGLSSRRQDYYLREMGLLNNSHKLMDRNLEMASLLKKDLTDQRRYFLNITHKIMDLECNPTLLYRNASISLLDSYIAIEKFIIETRLSYIDQYKLFDLLKTLLPNDDNQLTCQGFLSWLIWRVDQHQEQRRQSSTNHLFNVNSLPAAIPTNSHLKSNETISARDSWSSPCLVQYAQERFQQNISESSDIQQKIDRLQSVVLHLASNVDALNNPSNNQIPSPVIHESLVKHEHVEDNEPSEHEMEEDYENESSDIDHNTAPDFSVSTSTHRVHPMELKKIMYNGKNMMKHLRARTTITSFARHVACDLFTREEIMSKLHVDHNNERDVFLRYCISTAWNLTEQELHVAWPKIRNALLQLRRDAIAGKCVRMTKRKQQKSKSISNQYTSENEDD